MQLTHAVLARRHAHEHEALGAHTGVAALCVHTRPHPTDVCVQLALVDVCIDNQNKKGKKLTHCALEISIEDYPNTGETLYNDEILGTMKVCLLYQIFCRL